MKRLFIGAIHQDDKAETLAKVLRQVQPASVGIEAPAWKQGLIETAGELCRSKIHRRTALERVLADSGLRHAEGTDRQWLDYMLNFLDYEYWSAKAHAQKAGAPLTLYGARQFYNRHTNESLEEHIGRYIRPMLDLDAADYDRWRRDQYMTPHLWIDDVKNQDPGHMKARVTSMLSRDYTAAKNIRRHGIQCVIGGPVHFFGHYDVDGKLHNLYDRFADAPRQRVRLIDCQDAATLEGLEGLNAEAPP